MQQDISAEAMTAMNQVQSKQAEQAMAWHGWGSPVGVGLFLIGAGLAALLLRLAAFGF